MTKYHRIVTPYGYQPKTSMQGEPPHGVTTSAMQLPKEVIVIIRGNSSK